MNHIIYISRATKVFNREELIALLKESRYNNSVNEITGMLLYLNGKFIQVLEGSAEAVQNTFATIAKDKRHQMVIKVLEGNSPTRIFSDWQMGFRLVTNEDLDLIPGLKDIDTFFNENLEKEKGNLLLTMLGLFYKKNIKDYAILV